MPASFPSPAEDYVEGRIDLNRDLIKHSLSTFYIRVSGDSMVGAGIVPDALLVVDRAVEALDGHVVVARIDDELCVKRLSIGDECFAKSMEKTLSYKVLQILLNLNILGGAIRCMIMLMNAAVRARQDE